MGYVGQGHERLIGSTILLAETTDDGWFHLVTTTGEWYSGGRRVRLDLECPKCKEFRLVEIVDTGSKQQGFCSVCAHEWAIDEETEKAG